MASLRRKLAKAEREGLRKLAKIERDLLESLGGLSGRDDSEARPHRRRRRRRSRNSVPPTPAAPAAPAAAAAPPAAPRAGLSRRRRRLTQEERAYRQARRRANLKLSVAIHSVTYGLVLALILIASRSLRATVIVAMAWGIGLAIHYFVAVIAPRLRQRWIDEEVSPAVERNVTRERQVIEDRHVRSLEELSASIAHEIRNPITAAKSLVQQMGEDPVSGENIEYANVALEELDRVEKSISHLLRFAREEELRIEDLEMADVVVSAFDTCRDRVVRCGIEVEPQFDSRCAMRGDVDKLRRILINLISNALDAIEEGGVRDPRIEIMAGENLAGSEVWVRVRDNGPGMDPDTRARIFDPFYTTKASGTGLGLALSKKIIDAHGGSIEVQSDPLEGTEFVLTFPKDFRREGRDA